jgi:hypothetical protein
MSICVKTSGNMAVIFGADEIPAWWHEIIDEG